MRVPVTDSDRDAFLNLVPQITADHRQSITVEQTAAVRQAIDRALFRRMRMCRARRWCPLSTPPGGNAGCPLVSFRYLAEPISLTFLGSFCSCSRYAK